MSIQHPLVSTYVVTYNSSKTIIETLDSIYKQTYPHLELIISDDCSTDETITVCREWLKRHRNRFSHTEIITSPINTGISANDNRAFSHCNAEWAKGIAGDDILMPECIETLYSYAISHPEDIIIFGRMEGFGENNQEVEQYMQAHFDYSFFELSAKDQYHRLLFQGNCVPAPTSFRNVKRFRDLDFLNDERIPMVEDYPNWLRLTEQGIKLSYVDKLVVKYRISDFSISTAPVLSTRTKQSLSLIYLLYMFKPRFSYYRSPVRKAGEIRKYIHCAYDAWGGWFWNTLIGFDRLLASLLKHFGLSVKN